MDQTCGRDKMENHHYGFSKGERAWLRNPAHTCSGRYVRETWWLITAQTRITRSPGHSAKLNGIPRRRRATPREPHLDESIHPRSDIGIDSVFCYKNSIEIINSYYHFHLHWLFLYISNIGLFSRQPRLCSS